MSEAPKIDKLQTGLQQGFNNEELQAILLENLRKKIPDAEFVSYVITIAAEQGWTTNLITAGLKRSPDNMLLKEFALLDPLQAAIDSPPDKSKASGGEVERSLRSLINILKHVGPGELSGGMFGELHSYLAPLYEEYTKQSAETIAPTTPTAA